MTDTLTLPKVSAPTVSILMVTHGGGGTALRATESLVENTEPSYELVVVDNASPDGTAERMKSGLSGATIVANPYNEGFAQGSNQAAEIARGRYLCFLNPDAFVQPGWLAPLLAVLEADSSAGASVPLFLHPDGRVQEAGSALDSEGAVLAISDGDDAESLMNRFRRTVDFGSAACLLVRAELFAELGGFDRVYSPAYYEDADFCFKLAERGYKTIFEPKSRVIHLRGGTSRQAETLMKANRRVFVERWADRLAERRPLRADPSNPRHRLAARDADALERILVIDDRVPHHDRGSGDPRMAKLVSELVHLWPEARITFFGAIPSNVERYAPLLLDLGIEVDCAEKRFDRWFDARRYHYSVVLVSRADNIGRFERELRRTQPQARRIYDIEALSFRRLGQQGHKAADELRELEETGVRGADLIFCVSEEEAAFARSLTEAPVHVLTTYVAPIETPSTFAETDGVVFFGGFFAGAGGPNEDGAVMLVEKVMPDLWQAVPDLRLEIVGANPTPVVRELQGPRVEVVGFVPDPVERLSRARVHVHPLRYGAGIKLKLIDTMAAGLPFVTTSVGAEGLGLGELEDVLLADDPRELARQALALYSNEELWTRTQADLLRIARERYGRERFRTNLVDAFTHLGVAPPPDRAITAVE